MRRIYVANATQKEFIMEKMLALALLEGEGLSVEFKERLSNLNREIVAFANTVGGVIYLGVDDNGKIVGIEIDNSLKSQVTDIAHNCDPSISITLHEHRKERVLAIHVSKGSDRPYKCKEGFYIRNGPSTQKLKRDEIITLINQTDKTRFDETLNDHFKYPSDFSVAFFEEYLRLSGVKTNAQPTDILMSLGAAQETEDHKFKLTNAGILFFAKDPQHFFPESYITAVKYRTNERFDILDKKDFGGTLISQIENALAFVIRHMNVSMKINMSKTKGALGARQELYDYSPIAVREAVINAVAHRDYNYDSSHIYIHMFPDYFEIENPGGLFRGLALEDLGKRSIRRNRLIADLLHRSGFIERVGSGFSRMEHALKENSNPPLQVQVTNFFNLRFYKRIEEIETEILTPRQIEIFQSILNKGTVTKQMLTSQFNLSGDTILRDLNRLIDLGLIVKQGQGKAVVYHQPNK